VPAVDATTEQVYVAKFEEPVGPVFPPQEIPDTPAIDHTAVPVGVTPPVGPVTVAVNVNGAPSATLGALVVTKTAGANFETLTLYAVLGRVEK